MIQSPSITHHRGLREEAKQTCSPDECARIKNVLLKIIRKTHCYYTLRFSSYCSHCSLCFLTVFQTENASHWQGHYPPLSRWSLLHCPHRTYAESEVPLIPSNTHSSLFCFFFLFHTIHNKHFCFFNVLN